MQNKNKYQKLEDISEHSSSEDELVLKPHPSTKIVIPIQHTEFVDETGKQQSSDEEIQEIDFINDQQNENIEVKKKSMDILGEEYDEEQENNEQQKSTLKSDQNVNSARSLYRTSIKDYENIKSAKINIEQKKDQKQPAPKVAFADQIEQEKRENSSTSSDITSDDEDDDRVLDKIKDSGLAQLKKQIKAQPNAKNMASQQLLNAQHKEDFLSQQCQSKKTIKYFKKQLLWQVLQPQQYYFQ